MTGETENLVLDLLRGMRADVDGLRRDSAAVKQDVKDLRTEVHERFETVETQLEGIRYVLVASIGSVATDLKDYDARIAVLEGAPA